MTTENESLSYGFRYWAGAEWTLYGVWETREERDAELAAFGQRGLYFYTDGTPSLGFGVRIGKGGAWRYDDGEDVEDVTRAMTMTSLEWDEVLDWLDDAIHDAELDAAGSRLLDALRNAIIS